MTTMLLKSKTELILSQLESVISNSLFYSDISRIVENLFSINELKTLCTNKLKETNNTKLRKVFINTSQIDNILSNDLIVKILQYCETKEYRKIPCLSKSFKV